jgi:hypothetical protein
MSRIFITGSAEGQEALVRKLFGEAVAARVGPVAKRIALSGDNPIYLIPLSFHVV